MKKVKSNHDEIAKAEAAGQHVERSEPMVLITLYDRKTKRYTPPRIEATIDSAKRGLATAVNNAKPGESTLGDFPEDWTLYKIGTYNDREGVPAVHDLEFVCTADEVGVSTHNRQQMLDLASQGS